jgi:ribosomal-protein-alanine N-acetyltransferase
MDLVSILGSIPTITTGNIVLRGLTPEDADDLYSYYHNPNVYRHLDWNGPSTREEALRAIEFWNNGFKNGWIVRLGITKRDRKGIVGTIFLSNFEGHRAEIGYELSERFWRQGIMSESIEQILHLAFHTIGLKRVQAFVSLDNAPSQRLLEKMGFRKEGILREYEQHMVTKGLKDMIIYSVLSSDRKGKE